MENKTWHELHDLATQTVKGIANAELMERILEIYPLQEGQKYVGSLANHFRGRLKHEGVDSLLSQMDSVNLRKLITGITSKNSNGKENGN